MTISIMPEAFNDAAFWVTLTFATVIIWLALQAYWTRWAHRRVDELENRVEAMEKKVNSTNTHIEDLEKRNPFAFLKRAN